MRMAEYRTGVHWLADKIDELRQKYPRAKWQFEANSPTTALANYDEQLKRWELGKTYDSGQVRLPGITVEDPFTANDMARGCGHLQDKVTNKAMSHSDDPVVTAALHSAIMRPMGSWPVVVGSPKSWRHRSLVATATRCGC